MYWPSIFVHKTTIILLSVHREITIICTTLNIERVVFRISMNTKLMLWIFKIHSTIYWCLYVQNYCTYYWGDLIRSHISKDIHNELARNILISFCFVTLFSPSRIWYHKRDTMCCHSLSSYTYIRFIMHRSFRTIENFITYIYDKVVCSGCH